MRGKQRAESREQSRAAVAFVLLVAFVLSAPSAFSAPFKVTEDKDFITIYEGATPVLRYVRGEILPQGAPEDRRRSTYVDLLYSLDGKPLTEDAPKDHWHHRGLSWMWPKVTFDGVTKDLWTLKGVRQHYEKHEAAAQPDGALLRVWNRWEEDSTKRKLLNEQVTFIVQPAGVSGFQPDETSEASSNPRSRNILGRAIDTTDVSGFQPDETSEASSNPKSRNIENILGRAIDIELQLSAIDTPVSIGVSARGYGGLNLRFAPRKDTIITTSKGPVDKDVDRQRYTWADLSARFGESPEFDGIAIFDYGANPHFPTGWTLRPYGILNPALGSTSDDYTIEPGKPLTLRYRIYVHKGKADASLLHRMFDDYNRKGSDSCPVTR